MWLLIFWFIISNKPWGFLLFISLTTGWWSVWDKFYEWGKNKTLFAACRLNNSFKDESLLML